ncbi:fimbrial chaperone protein [Stella humosa]|uniref:Fimbrial chaperone protein n=1 Tax=Stella humosa TaxID=94 RepID=A0A3N1MAX4_9PROT|nr:fimbria/pilus periplasmic chaperone [Stella humosa]ROP99856.1 fimbrial chaperone protein [Stella humosa]
MLPLRPAVVARCLLVAGLAAVAPVPVAAQSLHTTAIRIELGPQAPIVSFEVVNPGTQDTMVHVRPVVWEQPGGEDRLTPSDRLVVSPPIFDLAPQGRQLVRVGLATPASGEVEQAFRLLIDEVPDRVKPVPGQIRTVVRISVPVFVLPNRPPAPRLAAGPMRAGALSLRNQGNTHVRVDWIVLRDRHGAELGRHKVFVYLLPGAERVVQVPIAPGREQAVAVVAMETDAGPLTSELR